MAQKTTKTSTHRSPIFLKGKKTVLRSLHKDDLPELWQFVNDAENRKFLGTFGPKSLEDEEAWYGHQNKKNGEFIFAVDTLDGQFLGCMGIHKICYRSQTAMTGAVLGNRQFQGKGFGTDAKMQLLYWAFTDLNLWKIKSDTMATNTRSQAYLKRTGYQEEGILHDEHYRGGERIDMHLFAVFRDDFLPLWEEYQEK